MVYDYSEERQNLAYAGSQEAINLLGKIKLSDKNADRRQDERNFTSRGQKLASKNGNWGSRKRVQIATWPA